MNMLWLSIFCCSSSFVFEKSPTRLSAVSLMSFQRMYSWFNFRFSFFASARLRCSSFTRFSYSSIFAFVAASWSWRSRSDPCSLSYRDSISACCCLFSSNCCSTRRSSVSLLRTCCRFSFTKPSIFVYSSCVSFRFANADSTSSWCSLSLLSYASRVSSSTHALRQTALGALLVLLERLLALVQLLCSGF